MTAEVLRWGDRVPNERLRAVENVNAEVMSRLDMDLEFALAEADDATHRAVAAWAALLSLELAGLVDLPAIAPAVAALRRGEPVPRPFGDYRAIWMIHQRSPVRRTSVPAPPDGDYEQSPQDWAIATVAHTAHPDSLAGVLETLVALAFTAGRDGYEQAFAEVRLRFPALDPVHQPG